MGDNPFIDWTKAISQLGGPQLLSSFVERFEHETFKSSLKSIQTNLKAREWTILKREAHSLKGASGYIAASLCTKLAEDLQYAAQETPIDEPKVNQCYNALSEHAKQLQAYLSKHLEKEFSDPEGIFNYKAGEVKIVIKDEPPAEDSNLSPEQKLMSSDGSTTYIIRRVNPPFSKVYQADDEYEMQEDDLPDAYDELNQQWKCLLF